MFRKSKGSNALLERDTVADIAGKTAVAAGHAAERAAQAAREARKVATPVVRRGAHTAAGALSEAAEHAAEVLATTADRLAASEAGVNARDKLADRAEALAAAVRPKKKRRVRKLLFVGAIAGGAVAIVKSPLKTKLANRIFGEPLEDDDIEAITLPVDEVDTTAEDEVVHRHTTPRTRRHSPDANHADDQAEVHPGHE